MGLSEMLGGIYSSLEDKFFSIMDFLDEKGIPVYSVIDPIEDRGIPFFPAFIAFLVAIFLLLGMLLFSGGSSNVTVEIKDQKGNVINNVSLAVTTENDDLLFTKTVNSGESFKVEGIPLGTTLYGRASKAGYATAEVSIPIKSREGNLVRILMRKEEKLITASIILKDDETGTSIRNATVKAKLADGSEIFCSFVESSASFECNGLVEGEGATIIVESPNYETESITKVFSEGSASEIRMTPTSASFTGSSSVVIKAYDADTKQVLKGVKVEIYKANETVPITSVVAAEGEYIESIPKGNVIRVVVSKEGYISYNSSAKEGGRTLRQDEEKFEAYLKSGAGEVSIYVSDQSGSPLTKAKVIVYDLRANAIASKESGFAGTAYFSDLNSSEKYYATAYQEGFLPKRITIEPSKSLEYRMELMPKTASNSAVIAITAVQSDGRPANSAVLNFYEIDSNNAKLPLGLPQDETDLEGKFIGYAPLGITLLVEASKQPEIGSAEKKIEVARNEIFIYLTVAEGLVKISLVDEYGNDLTKGKVKITDAAGNVLYDDDLNGSNNIWINRGDAKNVRLHYESPEGKVYDEELNLEGKRAVEVKAIAKEPEGLAPKIEFMGIFTAADKQVEAVTKGKDYYAKFKLELPSGKYKSGIHVRVGSDDVKNADASDVGIIGYSAVGVKSYFYGRTYNKEPLPGYEGIDRQNQGKAGEYNKWLELGFEDSGTKIIKIRIKAKETAVSDSFELKYRAWVEAAGKIYRSPRDILLKEEPYTKEIMGLYAETEKESIRIFSSSFNCESSICASYKFIGENGSEAMPENFKAVKGNKYALEIELVSMKNTNVDIRANTDASNPKIYFTGSGVNSSRFPDENTTNTSTEIKAVPLAADEKANVRVYFNAVEEGPSNITMQVISEELIKESFSFNIYLEKNMVVSFEPEEPLFGEDFFVKVKDDEGNPVEKANVRIINKQGIIVKNISPTNEIGRNGIYKIKNNLDAGTYKLEVSAEGFKPYQNEISILKSGILSIAKELKVSIPKGSDSAQIKVKVENTGNARVESIRYEIVKAPDFPSDMDIIIMMPASIEKKSSQYGSLTAEYSGKEERSHGEATLKVIGKVINEYDVVAESKIVIDYNPKFENCLEISKERLVAYLASSNAGNYLNSYGSPYDYENYNSGYSSPYYSRGSNYSGNSYDDYYNQSYSGSIGTYYGNSYESANYADMGYYYNSSSGSYSTSKKKLELKVKNNCEGDLTITPEAVALGEEDEGIRITANSVTLKGYGAEGSEKSIYVEVSNESNRNYPDRKTLSYDLRLKSDSITESVPLDVILWNPKAALLINRNVEVWLAATENPSMPSARIPIYARNAGEADIENLTFTIATGQAKGYASIRILPTNNVPVLPKGSALNPPIYIEVQAGAIEKSVLQDIRQINVFGTIDGKRYDFGPIYVTSHISPADCLKVSPSKMSFTDKALEGAINKPVTITNGCSEEVIIRAVEPTTFGKNYLDFYPQGLTLRQGQTSEVQLILHKREAWNASVPIFARGFLVRSQRWVASQPIEMKILLGEVAETQEATTVQEIPLCGDEKNSSLEVRMPKAALTNECEAAYCDAEQLADFIASRIREKVNEAHNLILHNNENIQNTQCDPNRYRGYCPFSLLGVQDDEYTVYFMNDNLTPEMLKATIEKNAPSIKYFGVDYSEHGAAPETMLSAVGNKIYLDRAISGCGRYTISINGAVKVSGTKLLKEYMAVVVSVNKDMSGKEQTAIEQCLPKIGNAVNFLPVNKDYGPKNSMGSWLSITQAENEQDKDIAEKLASSLFNNKERFVSGISPYRNNSRIIVRPGEPEGYLVKLSMVKNVSGPATIYADIMQTSGKDEKSIVEEAAKAIAGFREGAIDGCISPNEDYVLLKSAKSFSDLKIESPAYLGLKYQQDSCIDMNIVGNAMDSVELKAEFIGQRTGVDAFWFEQASGSYNSQGLLQQPGNEPKLSTKVDTVVLQKNEERKAYVAKVRLCTKGLADVQNAHNKQIRVYAEYKASGKSAEPKTITLQVCGIHPYDLIAKLSETKQGKYYATPIWAGEPSYITIGDMKRIMDSFSQLKNAELYLSGEKKPDVIKQTATKEDIAKRKALGWYVGVCSGTNLTLGLVFYALGGPLGWMKAIFDALTDCVVPFGWEFMDTFPWGRNIKETMAGFASEVPWIGNWLNSVFSPSEIKQIEEAEVPTFGAMAAEAVSSDLFIAGMTTGSARAAGYAIYTANEYSTTTARIAASSISQKIVDNIMESAGAGGTMPAVSGMKLKSALQDEILKNLEKSMSNASKKELKDWSGKLNEATKEAVAKVAEDKEFSESFFKYMQTSAKGKSAIDDALKDIANEYAEKAKLKEAFSKERVFSASASVEDIKDSIAGEIKAKLKSAYGPEAGEELFARISPAVSSELDDLIKEIDLVDMKISAEKMAQIGDATESLVKSEFKKIAKSADEIAGFENLEKLRKAMRTAKGNSVFAEVGEKAADKALQESASLTKWGRFKKYAGSLFSFRTLGTLVREAGKAAASNFMGNLAYDYVLKKELGKADDKRVDIVGSGLANVDSTGEGLPNLLMNIESDEQKIDKGFTYEIIVSDIGAGKSVRFVDIKDGRIAEDAQPLDKECNQENLNEGVDAIMPSLIPNADVVPLGISDKDHWKMVKAYLEKRQEGARYSAIIAVSATDEIKEELLATVAIWKSAMGTKSEDNVTGCDYAINPIVSADKSFKCAAGKLDNIRKSICTQDDEKEWVICTLKEYNKEPNKVTENSDKDYEALYAVYKTWKSYRSITPNAG